MTPEDRVKVNARSGHSSRLRPGVTGKGCYLLHAMFVSTGFSARKPVNTCGKAGDVWISYQTIWCRTDNGWEKCDMQRYYRPKHPFLPDRLLTLHPTHFFLQWIQSESRRFYQPKNWSHEVLLKAGEGHRVLEVLQKAGLKKLVNQPFATFGTPQVSRFLRAVLPSFSTGRTCQPVEEYWNSDEDESQDKGEAGDESNSEVPGMYHEMLSPAHRIKRYVSTIQIAIRQFRTPEPGPSNSRHPSSERVSQPANDEDGQPEQSTSGSYDQYASSADAHHIHSSRTRGYK